MIHLAAQGLCLAGFAALAFAMTRTQRDVLGARFARRTVIALRIAGIAALLAALGVLTDWQGFALGLVMFSGHTSLAAGLVHAGLIALARRHARRSRRAMLHADAFTTLQH